MVVYPVWYVFENKVWEVNWVMKTCPFILVQTFSWFTKLSEIVEQLYIRIYGHMQLHNSCKEMAMFCHFSSLPSGYNRANEQSAISSYPLYPSWMLFMLGSCCSSGIVYMYLAINCMFELYNNHGKDIRTQIYTKILSTTWLHLLSYECVCPICLHSLQMAEIATWTITLLERTKTLFYDIINVTDIIPTR